jgi:osmotically-inducible protein OsmY
VQTAGRVSDLEIRAYVRERFQHSASLERTTIVVGVKERVVKLSGTVATADQKDEAERLASGVPSVEAVNSAIVVAGDSPAAGPASREAGRSDAGAQ